MDRRSILETALFDSQEVVTIQYLSRHADIPINDARIELEKFYLENKHRAELHAVFVVSGELNTGGSSSASSCRQWHTQFVLGEDLEKTREGYCDVTTCEICCLHTKSLKSICVMYSADSLDDDDFMRSDPERSWLCNPEALLKRKEMIKSHSQSAGDKLKSTVASGGSLAETSEMKNADTLPDTLSAPKEAVHSKTNVSKSSQKQSSQKRSLSIMDAFQKQKRPEKRVLVDNEENSEAKGSAKDDDGNTSQASGQIDDGFTQKKEKLRPKRCMLTQDDLFSDGGSSPERMDFEEQEETDADAIANIKKQAPSISNNSTVVKESKISSRSADSEEHPKITRKEYVTETTLDADGFMVTKRVLKEIEVEQAPAEARSDAERKTHDAKAEAEKFIPIGKKLSSSQAKISSFFKKQ